MFSLVGSIPWLPIGILLASWLLLRRHGAARWRGTSPWLVALDAAPIMIGWVTVTCVTARPLLASAIVATLAAILWLGDRAKLKASGEPLVYSDVLQVSVLLHPPLYAEFMTPWMLAGGIAVTAVILVGLGSLEPPHWNSTWPAPVVAIVAVVGWKFRPSSNALTAFLSRRGVPVASRDPVRDRATFGPLGTVIVHIATVRAERPDLLHACSPGYAPHQPPGHRNTSPVGPIVLFELESFFDARRLGSMVPRDLLGNYDRLAARASFHGQMTVPAYGANTVRTEFEALTGLPIQVLGLDRFNPYAAFARAPVNSIAWQLRALGYRTICVHPFARSFYARHLVMPQLGFDTFIDIAAFEPPGAGRRYVSDFSVVDMVAEQIALNGPKTFVFAITMGGHSPWPRLPGLMPPEHPDWPHFAGYLRSIADTDAALGRMAALLSQHGGPSMLAAFGDHQPSFPSLYRDLRHIDRTTDYLIWRSDRVSGGRADIMAYDLPGMVLKEATRAPSAHPELVGGVL